MGLRLTVCVTARPAPLLSFRVGAHLWHNELLAEERELKRGSMSMYQRVLKALCILLVAYAGCLAIAGLALIGVAVAGTSLDLQIDGAAVTGAEAIALCAAAGTIFLVVGLLDVIVAILGLRGVRRPEALKPFIVCASIILALNVVNTAYSAATGALSGNNLLNLLLPLFVQVLALLCAGHIRKEHAAGAMAASQPIDRGLSLGFMRVIQALFAINIIAVLVSCATLRSGTYTLGFSEVLDMVNLVFDGVSFWLIMQRSRGARYWIIGFSAFNIVAGTIYNVATGQFNVLDQLGASAFDIVLLLYFLFAKRPRQVLTVEFTARRCKELVVRAWDLWQPRTWSFWRSMIIYFCLFSIVGHWMEAGFCLFIKWGIVPGIYDPNSGIWHDYLNPFPVYGAGMVACAVLLFPIKNLLEEKLGGIAKPLVASFIVNALVCAVIELVLGLTSNMPDANGVYPLWDYSTMPFNFMGQICLQNTLLFGAVATLMTWVVYPALQREYLKLPEPMRQTFFVAVLVFYAIVVCLYVINITLPV